MNKKWKKFGLGIACLLATVGFAVGGAATLDNDTRYASATEISCEGILTEYVVGSSFTVPSATLVYNGENYEATDAALIFPDGIAKKGGTYTLLDTGEYTVVYTADCGGIKVRAEKKFSVTENNYTVSSDGSSVTYGELQTAKVAGTEGLIVNFASGDSFRYSKPIDLTKQDVTDVIMMYPVKGGAIHNAGIYTVTLTDCYDPTVYVNLIITFNQEDWEYIRAGANGQDEVGLFVPDARHPGSVKVDGELYYPHRNTYGASGKSPHMDPKGYGCRWLYNYAEQKVYLEERLGPKIINQFNHPDIYEEDQMFHGFTTGEVYLTLTPSAYNATTTQVEIESINGESGEALKLASNYKDDRAPTLKVDFKDIDAQQGVYAAKGAKFKLFEATANDIHIAAGGVETKVYYNYGNAYQTSVLTENGYFTPTNLGRYTIVYTAKDTFGNEAVQTVTVYSVDTEDGKGIQFSAGSVAELLAGKDNVLSEYTVSGLNGEAQVEIYAQKDGVKTQIDPETLVFVPLQHGEYEIIYRYFDSVYEYEYSYKVNSVASDEIRFLDEFVLPRHFIKDAYYTVEEIFAYSFENENPTAYKAQFMVSFDKGMFVEKNSERVLIEGDSTVQFKFVYQGKEIVSGLYPIVDVNFEETSGIEKYFVGEEISTEARGKAVYVQANKMSGDVKFSFVNPISVSSFDFRFTPPKSQANYSEFRIILTDYYDRTNQKVITYKKNAEGYYFSVGGKDYEVSSAYDFADGELKKVWYDALVKKVLNNYSMSVSFDFGFKTDMCLLDLEFVGIDGEAAVELKQINNQALVNYGMDLAVPSIGVVQSGGAYQQGTTVTIHRAYMTDILSPILSSDLIVSVEGPSGYVTSVDGVLLDGNCNSARSYDITLEEYGSYIVSYYGKDQNDLENTVVYRISVVDGEAPVLTFKNLPDGMPTVKVGKNYTIANYAVTDNYSAPEKVSVTLFVYDQYFGLIATNVKSFTPTQAGIYTVYAHCMDEAGNSSYTSYRVKAV